ncbi:hypothetical protein BJV38_001372 [Clostridium beijerinckii]|nr:hypothetical protein [Clostridium beijerinckii]NRT44529.1 hypothetical protein [Clostridium beijerinckii]NRZ21479.1 hypothetical protein [Clostridium beijerinckii]
MEVPLSHLYKDCPLVSAVVSPAIVSVLPEIPVIVKL